MASTTTNGSNSNVAVGITNRLKIPVISEDGDRDLQLPESKTSNVNFSSSWVRGQSLDAGVADTEDPDLLSQLQFVSPKAGVFRPIESAANSSGKKSTSLGRGVKLKTNTKACSIM